MARFLQWSFRRLVISICDRLENRFDVSTIMLSEIDDPIERRKKERNAIKNWLYYVKEKGYWLSSRELIFHAADQAISAAYIQRYGSSKQEVNADTVCFSAKAIVAELSTKLGV